MAAVIDLTISSDSEEADDNAENSFVCELSEGTSNGRDSVFGYEGEEGEGTSTGRDSLFGCELGEEGEATYDGRDLVFGWEGEEGDCEGTFNGRKTDSKSRRTCKQKLKKSGKDKCSVSEEQAREDAMETDTDSHPEVDSISR